MGMSSIAVPAIIAFLELFAFVFAIGAEMRRNTGRVVPDEYDVRTFCVYDSDASTVYGLAALGLMLLSQAIVSVSSRCLCLGRPLTAGRLRSCAIWCFAVSWLTFLAAEACLLAGSAKNAYHTKYVGYFAKRDLLSCATLRKGVFGAAAALILVSLVASLSLCYSHSKVSTAGWQKHQNEGLEMADDKHLQKDEFVNVNV